MKFVLFYHSLASDWNHGNAHFLRGVVSELLARGHAVDVYEPEIGWSRRHLVEEHGRVALARFAKAFPELQSHLYDPDRIDLDVALDDADIAIVHEWNPPAFVARVGVHASHSPLRLFFHDTHHRSVTDPEAIAALDLRHYHGVLAFGREIADRYLENNWAPRAWVWHEAADVRRFRPLRSDAEEGDLVWIGNWGDDERSAELREFLIGPVARLGLRARIYGVRYPEDALAALRAAQIEYGGWIANYEAPAAFSRYRCTVHVPRRAYAEKVRGVPTIRMFEALACGIPLVSAPWEDSEGLFRPEVDYLVARDGRQMKSHLRSVLNDPALAASLRASGLETIRARHTCAHRVDELLEIVARLERPRAANGEGRAGNLAPGHGGRIDVVHALPARRAPLVARSSIAMFGSSLVSAYWNGAATYYRGVIRALHDIGFDVTFYEPDAYGRQAHRDIADPDWASVVVFDATEEGVQRALEDARRADIVIKASGVGVFDELLEAEVARMGAPGTTTIFWDVDAPATLARMRANAGDAFIACVRRYDLVLTYGGGAAVVQEYTRFGARRCVPIYNALDPSTHYPVARDPRFVGDLAFLGNRLPDREARVREFFLDPARRLPDRRFILGGNGWGENAILTPNVAPIGHVYTRDHNAFNCSPRAVININRESMADIGYSPPTRVFEAAGAAACLICDAWAGIEQFLEPGAEVLCASSGEEVVELLTDLSAEAARRIGAAARRRILAQHTYEHRARELRALLDMETLRSTRVAHSQENMTRVSAD
jgi:spore maturation protein CgeB